LVIRLNQKPDLISEKTKMFSLVLKRIFDQNDINLISGQTNMFLSRVEKDI
jgi:hypothetical protein